MDSHQSHIFCFYRFVKFCYFPFKRPVPGTACNIGPFIFLIQFVLYFILTDKSIHIATTRIIAKCIQNCRFFQFQSDPAFFYILCIICTPVCMPVRSFIFIQNVLCRSFCSTAIILTFCKCSEPSNRIISVTGFWCLFCLFSKTEFKYISCIVIFWLNNDLLDIVESRKNSHWRIIGCFCLYLCKNSRCRIASLCQCTFRYRIAIYNDFFQLRCRIRYEASLCHLQLDLSKCSTRFPSGSCRCTCVRKLEFDKSRCRRCEIIRIWFYPSTFFPDRLRYCKLVPVGSILWNQNLCCSCIRITHTSAVLCKMHHNLS